MNIEDLTFHVPPSCQGQAVTYAYAVDTEVSSDRADCIIRCITRPGEPDTYQRFIDPEWEDEYSTNLEFWSAEPKLGECVAEWQITYSVVFAEDFQPVEDPPCSLDTLEDARRHLNRMASVHEGADLAILRCSDPQRGATECSLDGGETWERYC